MKITQRMIDQARMIAEAKVGQELEEFYNGVWRDPDGSVLLNNGNYAYRLKPEPRTIWVNEYSNDGVAVYRTQQAALNNANCGDHVRIAVEYREVIK